MAMTFAAHPHLAPALEEQTAAAVTIVRETVWQPAADFARERMAFSGKTGLAKSAAAAPRSRKGDDGFVRPAIAPRRIAAASTPQFAVRADDIVLPDLPPLAAPEQPVRARNRPAPPPGGNAPSPTDERAAALRLKASLIGEMLKSFEMFVYVSKADRGPLAQRMYVFRKQPDDTLKLLYDWAASTGRERNEISPLGVRDFTDTPRGYYEIDPHRMYWRYHSHAWNQAMPYSMFFNWQRNGLATGLAIHGASGDDIGRLGQRASAGCVHIAPENAKLLYHLIRADYKGRVPRLAYDRRTAGSSNSGDFRHDAKGRLMMADGYKVLIFIEDYGGENVAAALF